MSDMKTHEAIEEVAEELYGVDVDGEALFDGTLERLEREGVLEQTSDSTNMDADETGT